MAETWVNPGDGKLVIGQAALEATLAYQDMGDHDFGEPYGQELESHMVSLHGMLQAAKNGTVVRAADRRSNDLTWTDETLLETCRWTANLLTASTDSDGSGRQLLRQPHLRVMASFGLLPWCEKVGQRLGTMPQIRQKIGQDTAQTPNYSLWREWDFAAYAAKVQRRVGERKPNWRDYREAADAGEGPSLSSIDNYIGSIACLNELIGWPIFEAMDDEDVVEWYGQILLANRSGYLSQKMIHELSKRDRSPSYKQLLRRFDYINNLRGQAVEIASEKIFYRRRQLEYFENHRPTDPQGTPLTAELNDDDKIAYAAKYQVARHFLPSLASGTIAGLALRTGDSFVGGVHRKLRNTRRIDPGHIELQAQAMGFGDVLWPMPDYTRHLIVSDKVLGLKPGYRQAKHPLPQYKPTSEKLSA